MPQMAPLLWFYLYGFFLISLMLFLIINFYFKPFSSPSLTPSTPPMKTPWKL
nr:ATP synthase F0 subunit 8 [Jonas distinctus]